MTRHKKDADSNNHLAKGEFFNKVKLANRREV